MSCLIFNPSSPFSLIKLIDMIMGLRVTEEAEREGLDIAEHGEKAYNP
jgi:Amt family ammonium transporter